MLSAQPLRCELAGVALARASAVVYSLSPAALRTLKLSERLDGRTVEELQGEGAGPKTVAALRELAAEFRSFVDTTATKNNVEFRNYRKFSADTSVNFDDPEAQPLLNEDKTKGQAAPKQ